MVAEILKFLHKEIRGLHEAAYLLGFFALCSQLLALVRDRLLAGKFGAGPELDVYYAAFRIPDVIFVTLASLVSVYVLIPLLAERSSVSKEAEQRFVSSLFTTFFLSIALVSAVVYFFTPHLVSSLFPGIVLSGWGDQLVLLCRILLLQPILLGVSNLFASITQVHRKFILYALSPILYNVGIIVGIVGFYPVWGISGLAFGVVLGALLHLGVQLPFIISNGFLPRITFRPKFAELATVLKLSLPRTLGLSANQLSLLVLVSFASVMASGSIAVFNLAYNLQAVPLTIIGISYSVAAFPTLARLFSKGERAEFLQHVVVAARHIIFWSFPALVLFIVLRAQIVRVIFGTGSFDWSDTRLTAAGLALFAVSLAAQSLVLLFVRGYYASGNTTTPLVVNLLFAGLTVTSAYVLVWVFNSYDVFRYFMESLLRVSGVGDTAVLMLPLAYSAASGFNAFVLWFLFQRDFSSFSASLGRSLVQSFAASVVLGIFTYQALGILDDVFNLDTFWGIFWQGFLAGCIGILAGIVTLLAMRNSEIADVWVSFHRKFWKAQPVAPEQTEL
jgi:putative peptidoglycan lipid II flippase